RRGSRAFETAMVFRGLGGGGRAPGAVVDLLPRGEGAGGGVRGSVGRGLARPRGRFGDQAARVRAGGSRRGEGRLLDAECGAAQIVAAVLPSGSASFPALTPHVPAAHWAERAIGDLFGLRPEGHPRSKGMLLHEAWPEKFAPLLEAAPGAAGGSP